MTNIVGGFNYIQQESVQFNNPVSESSLSAMGSSINGLLSVLLPVGSIVHSMLTETQFQTQIGSTNWVLADGRSVIGSEYQTITSFSNIPDLRGLSIRNKNNGRADGFQNPDGDLALGTTTASRFTSHTHSYTDPTHYHTFPIGKNGSDNQSFSPPYGSTNGNSGHYQTDPVGVGITIQPVGGNDTAPTNVTTNCFIRIN